MADSSTNANGFNPVFSFSTNGAAPSVTNANATLGTANTANATLGTANTANTTLGTANTTTAALGQVDPSTGTVAGQMATDLNANSPYLQAARSKANQASNDRGILNSTMGVQAGESAAINAALPIATSDAGAYNTQSLTNQATQNQTNQFNTTALNNQGLVNQAAENQTSQFNAGAANASNTAAFNAQTNLNQTAAQGTVNAHIQQMQNETQLQLDATDNTYKQLMQTTASAQQTYASGQATISAIMTNPNIAPSEKQQMINSELGMMNGGLAVIDATNNGTLNTNLSGLLNFNTSNMSSSTTSDATALANQQAMTAAAAKWAAGPLT